MRSQTLLEFFNVAVGPRQQIQDAHESVPADSQATDYLRVLVSNTVGVVVWLASNRQGPL